MWNRKAKRIKALEAKVHEKDSYIKSLEWQFDTIKRNSLNINMTVEDSMKIISKAIREDDGYAIAWQSNVAMLLYDFAQSDSMEHKDANRLAGEFIERLFGRNTEELV